jgi:hypothetical protein
MLGRRVDDRVPGVVVSRPATRLHMNLSTGGRVCRAACAGSSRRSRELAASACSASCWSSIAESVGSKSFLNCVENEGCGVRAGVFVFVVMVDVVELAVDVRGERVVGVRSADREALKNEDVEGVRGGGRRLGAPASTCAPRREDSQMWNADALRCGGPLRASVCMGVRACVSRG